MSATQYKFNAYTPTEAGTPSITSNTLSVSGVNSNAQVDLVMAYAQVTKENFRKVVNMKFHHALSAINFSFKLKEGFTYTNTYQVNNIQWSNVIHKEHLP